LLRDKVPQDSTFLEWLDEYLPEGWEISIVNTPPRKEELLAYPEVHSSGPSDLKEFYAREDNNGSTLIEAPVVLDNKPIILGIEEEVEELSARDIFNLRIKDNPRKAISSIVSVHKLRRALTLCKGDKRKGVLTSIIRKRIKVLVSGTK